MTSKKENILNFPIEIIEEGESVKNVERKQENEIKDKLKRLGSLPERIKYNEWQQEYFLIYNSYVLDNV